MDLCQTVSARYSHLKKPGDPLAQAATMDVVAQIYASMRSGNVADFLAKLSGGFSLSVKAAHYREKSHPRTAASLQSFL